MATLMSREWDAEGYHRVSAPQFAWGMRVLERSRFSGDERVLDAGCGTGRLTAELSRRLPRGSVTALDLSQRMAAAARETLRNAQAREGVPGAGQPPAVVCADLLALPFRRAFDVIFSTATFHWVLDHDRLFAALYEALLPDGRIEAQCGGGPNLDHTLRRANAVAATPEFAPYFRHWRRPSNFATADATEERLRAAGFTHIRCWLEEAPAPFSDSVSYRAFLETVVLRPFLALLPTATLRDRLLDVMTERAERDDPPLTLDYWRLNISARRP